VNRTLINYYFRSRDNLFNLVFEEAQLQEKEKSDAILSSNISFREKISQFIEDSMASALEYPYLEIYIVTQLNQGCVFKDPEHFEEMVSRLDKELKIEIEKGTIEEIPTLQFILNIASLVSFPTCMRPLLKESLKISDEDYNKLLGERKEVILKTIFKNKN
jgi:TetR/AcrR family transcriptional regulator